MSVFARPAPQKRVARGGIEGAADGACWAASPGLALDFEALFATTGLFGIEFGAEALASDGLRVRMAGYMSPPVVPEACYFVLSRSPLPNCPFCDAAATWPDDIVLVEVRHPGVDIDHPQRPVTVSGLLTLGDAIPPEPGLHAGVRLRDAVWIAGEMAPTSRQPSSPP